MATVFTLGHPVTNTKASGESDLSTAKEPTSSQTVTLSQAPTSMANPTGRANIHGKMEADIQATSKMA